MQLLALAKPHLLTVEEYMTLDALERTELLGGVVYDVSPVNPPYANAVSRLNRVLTRGVADEYAIRIQSPIAVHGWRGRDAPEVDVSVLQAKRYANMVPTAKDAWAFIEVSDRTYRDDRDYKLPLYVGAGVPSWIVNIELRQVEAYSSAADLALPHGRVIAEGESFEVCGVSIPVADLFDEMEMPD